MQQLPVLISGPLSLGDIIDRAIRLYRAYFGPLVLTAAVLLAPYGIINAILTATAPPASPFSPSGQADDPFTSLLGFYSSAMGGSDNPLLSIVGAIAGFVVGLALAFQCIELIHHRQPGLGESLSGGLRRVWSYLGNVLILALIFGLGTLILMIPLFFLPELCMFPLILLVFLPAIFYLMARWIAILPVIVAEEAGPVEALRRSWDLTQGMVWRSIGFSLLTSLLGMIVTGLPTLTIVTILNLAMGGTPNPVAFGVANALGTVANILWYPIAMALTVFYYYDLRVRHEGYDLSLRVDRAASGLGPEPSV
jgi:hypothetical protein